MIFKTCLNLPSNTYATAEELQRLSQSLFFFSNCSSQHDRTVTSIFLALLLPSCSHCFFSFLFLFFDTTNRYEVFLARPKSHNLRTENKMSQIIAWRVLWDSATKTELRTAATDERQRKNWTRPRRTSAWWDYFVNEVVLLNIYFTQAQSQVQLVFIIFELFSVNRRNQLENYTVVWAKIISSVLFEINCISVAGAWFFASLSG